MNLRAGGADTQFLSADELAVEAELQGYAARVSPLPSAAFMDRVVTAAERSPLPIAGSGPRLRAIELVYAANRRLRVALAQVAGGPSIPLRVRIQAGVMLVVVALMITAGTALAAAGAAAGASIVVNWVSGPQVHAIASQTTVAPTPGQDPSVDLRTDQPQRTDNPNVTSNPGNGGKPSQNPGNCGKPSQNPGNGNQPSQNPGNCGQPGQNPGNQPTNHPNASNNPGNGNKPTKNP
jgi:hypothetical protein